MANDWLLLLHQIPPAPAYLRAKILRRLKQLGALAIKNSAYVLPATDETLEDFQWLLREVASGGGEGWIFRTEPVAGMTDDQLRSAFRDARAADYRELAADASRIEGIAEWQRLRKRFEDIAKIDFFTAPGRQEVETLMETIARSLESPAAPSAADAPLMNSRGRTWVTRAGIKVDRIASAWLIRRFIDPQAKFHFVDPNSHIHRDGELRFDMFEGEFTHQGDLCTFEVLLRESGLADAGLRAIAEIVHDLDLKEEKYQRPETAGVAALISGLTRHASDQQRLEEGCVVFEALYARLGQLLLQRPGE